MKNGHGQGYSGKSCNQWLLAMVYAMRVRYPGEELRSHGSGAAAPSEAVWGRGRHGYCGGGGVMATVGEGASWPLWGRRGWHMDDDRRTHPSLKIET